MIRVTVFTLALFGSTVHAAATKVFCQVAHGEVAASETMQPGATYTFDLASLTGEGIGQPKDLGAMGPVPMNLNVYYTNYSEHQLTMQLDERLSGGASEMLAATDLAPHGMSQLSYRAPGGTHLVFLACGLVTDDQLAALEDHSK